MLGTLTAALVLFPSMAMDRHTLHAAIQPWSTARFEVMINGKEVLKVRRKEKIELGPFLRRGENSVEIRYRTEDGMPSLHQPALLTIESRNGSKKTILRIAASLDNPRGKSHIVLRVD